MFEVVDRQLLGVCLGEMVARQLVGVLGGC